MAHSHGLPTGRVRLALLLLTLMTLLLAFRHSVSAACTPALLLGVGAHSLWDMLAIPVLLTVGWKLKARQICHDDHREACCQNPIHDVRGQNG